MIVTLASASPRRKQLIAKIDGLQVNVVPATGEENAPFTNAGAYACALARAKAEEVSGRCGGVVVGADTIVVFEGKPLGKPQDKQGADAMLSMLSGAAHSVITGVCVIGNGKCICRYCETQVVFDELPEGFVKEYIESGSPMDKAGAYGLQDELLRPYVKEVNGDRDNVIGLPVGMLKEILQEIVYAEDQYSD